MREIKYVPAKKKAELHMCESTEKIYKECFLGKLAAGSEGGHSECGGCSQTETVRPIVGPRSCPSYFSYGSCAGRINGVE